MKYFKYLIHALGGQLVYITTLHGSFIQVDMSHFEKGIYFVMIRSKDFARTQKVVKL